MLLYFYANACEFGAHGFPESLNEYEEPKVDYLVHRESVIWSEIQFSTLSPVLLVFWSGCATSLTKDCATAVGRSQAGMLAISSRVVFLSILGHWSPQQGRLSPLLLWRQGQKNTRHGLWKEQNKSWNLKIGFAEQRHHYITYGLFTNTYFFY